ncbi:MAG: A/G-specific adenine glycosylase [Planctomycetes bacterium]|nr:A/G-specific adenine glycosylase [Planctomycetota bacterium]
MPPLPDLAQSLLAWYDRHKRNLPWRRTSAPWAILVSEVMLQQTRVEVVLDYYERFLRRYPDAQSLAAVSEADLLAAWSGLGYYRRARHLQAAARAIVEKHGGAFPRDFDAILSLQGVGRSTAGAVASIAFGLPYPVVDGNVARVLARLFLLEGDLRRRALARRFWDLAEELLDRKRPGDCNQAFMELGAVTCLRKKPRCLLCPLAGQCRARREGRCDDFPARRARRPPVPVRLVAVLLRQGNAVALVKRAPGTLMAGLLDVPALEVGASDDARASAARWLKDRFGLGVRGLEQAGVARHAITHRRVRVEVFAAQPAARETAALIREARGGHAPAGIAPEPDEQGLLFVAPEETRNLALSALARKILAAGGL